MAVIYCSSHKSHLGLSDLKKTKIWYQSLKCKLKQITAKKNNWLFWNGLFWLWSFEVCNCWDIAVGLVICQVKTVEHLYWAHCSTAYRYCLGSDSGTETCSGSYCNVHTILCLPGLCVNSGMWCVTRSQRSSASWKATRSSGHHTMRTLTCSTSGCWMWRSSWSKMQS